MRNEGHILGVAAPHDRPRDDATATSARTSFRPLPADGVQGAAAVLAAAFAEDPFYAWLVPDPSHRQPGLMEYFAAKLTRQLRDGTGWTIVSASGRSVLVGERVADATAAGPALPADSREVLTHWVSPEHLEHIAAVFDAIPHPDYDHVYLDVIATDPGAQRHGEGSALARRWLRSLPETTRQVHLDSSSRQNISFYERLGFRAGPAVALPHGAGHLTPMDLELTLS